MPSTMQSLGIDQLSPEHRLQLIGEIWDSISLEETPIPESHREELDRRLESAETNPLPGRPWAEVHARLRGEP